MTASPLFSPGPEQRALAEQWLDDLQWHKQMYDQSRFRWTAEHVMTVVTRRTNGQLDFRTVRDLSRLQTQLGNLMEYTAEVRRKMGERLAATEKTIPKDVSREAVGLSKLEASRATYDYVIGYASNQSMTNLNIRATLKRIPLRNPLSEAWELKQLLRMYEAAIDTFEDTVCDLGRELLETNRPMAVLVEASQSFSAEGLMDRLEQSRKERGLRGDPRRVPRQLFA